MKLQCLHLQLPSSKVVNQHTELENSNHLKMYLVLKMAIFYCHLSFRGWYLLLLSKVGHHHTELEHTPFKNLYQQAKASPGFRDSELAWAPDCRGTSALIIWMAGFGTYDVDGSKIRRENPLIWQFFPLFTTVSFIHVRWLGMGFLP